MNLPPIDDTVYVSDFDRAHVNEIMRGMGDWTTCRILRLCQSADTQTLARIKAGFPDIVELFFDWRERRENIVNRPFQK